MPFISIIMPIYNADCFLEKSLSSVLTQSLENIEVICVNDGSTDNSLNIINKYAKKDRRIKIINKKNSGYGNTMNNGLKIAQGEYVGILEPDDFMDKKMCQILYYKAKEMNIDVIKSNYFEYNKGKSDFFEVLYGLPYDKITSANENDRILHMRPCIWSALYKRSLLRDSNIWFTETPGASYQDTSFAFKVWVCSKRVFFVKDAFLNYRIDNINSSVKSIGKIFSICDEFQSIEAFLNQNVENRMKYSKILQVLKLDSYMWNLGRIAPKFKKIFKDQIALEFIKADYDGFLDENYFDQDRWNQVQNCIQEYYSQDMVKNKLKQWLKKKF